MIAPLAPTDVVGADIWELMLDGNLLLRTPFSNRDVLEISQPYPGSYPGGDYAARSGVVAIHTLGYLFT